MQKKTYNKKTFYNSLFTKSFFLGDDFLANNYKHIPEEMTSSATTLSSLIDEYNEKLKQMQQLNDTINSSPSWKNNNIKLAFNQTSNGYMKVHNNRALNLSFNVEKLKEKARVAAEFEQAYTRGR